MCVEMAVSLPELSNIIKFSMYIHEYVLSEKVECTLYKSALILFTL